MGPLHASQGRKEGASHGVQFHVNSMSIPCQGATAPQTVGDNLGRCGSSRQLRMGGWSSADVYLGTPGLQGQDLTLL